MTIKLAMATLNNANLFLQDLLEQVTLEFEGKLDAHKPMRMEMADFLNLRMARQNAFNGIVEKFQFTIEHSSTEEYIMARPLPADPKLVQKGHYTGKLKFRARMTGDSQFPAMALFQEYRDVWGGTEWHEVEIEYE